MSSQATADSPNGALVGTDRQGARVEVDGCDLFTFDGDLIRVKNSLRKQRR